MGETALNTGISIFYICLLCLAHRCQKKAGAQKCTKIRLLQNIKIYIANFPQIDMPELHEIPHLIHANGGAIIDNISKTAVAEYAFLKMQLHQSGDLTQDAAFQERFQDLHQFNVYRVKPAVRKRVFEVLEAVKSTENPDIRQIALELTREADLKNFQLKQFYVVSTILHLLDDRNPLYDRHNAYLFDFSTPGSMNLSNYQQMTLFIEHYEALRTAFDSLLENKYVQDLLKVVKIKFSAHKDVLSLHKRLDLLLRSAGDLKQKGLLIHASRVAELNE